MRKAPLVVLTIGGFDPSSGAGVTADVKTIAAHGCFGIACVTALTVQSTMGVRRIQPMDATLISETLEALASDFVIGAVHIGMLGNAGVVGAVTRFLLKTRAKNIVLDPILRATSGAELIDPAGFTALKEHLMPIARLVTPNLDEAGTLTGTRVTDVDQMKFAALKLHALGARGVVITGGHLPVPWDLLSWARDGGFQQELFQAPKQPSRATHGTGCAFSTALACRLALGETPSDAVRLAKQYVGKAIGAAYKVGHGLGPIHHLYQLNQRRDVRIRRKTK